MRFYGVVVNLMSVLEETANFEYFLRHECLWLCALRMEVTKLTPTSEAPSIYDGTSKRTVVVKQESFKAAAEKLPFSIGLGYLSTCLRAGVPSFHFCLSLKKCFLGKYENSAGSNAANLGFVPFKRTQSVAGCRDIFQIRYLSKCGSVLGHINYHLNPNKYEQQPDVWRRIIVYAVAEP